MTCNHVDMLIFHFTVLSIPERHLRHKAVSRTLLPAGGFATLFTFTAEEYLKCDFAPGVRLVQEVAEVPYLQNDI